MYRIIGGDGKEYGPIPIEQLRQWLAEGRANGQTRVLVEGGAEWKPLGSFPELAALLPPPRTPASAGAGGLLLSGAPLPKSNSMALTGMVLGIVSITFGLCCCVGFPTAIAGIVFSSIGLAQVNRHPELYTGKGMAIAGLVMCLLALALRAVLWVLGFAITRADILRDLNL